MTWPVLPTAPSKGSQGPTSLLPVQMKTPRLSRGSLGECWSGATVQVGGVVRRGQAFRDKA